MLAALLQMVLLIVIGVLWKQIAPSHISAQAHRRAITDLVFYLLLPALVLDIIWQTPLNLTSVYISFVALSAISVGLILMWFSLRLIKTNKKQTGTLLLAAAFPNATYLGLPVLAAVLGEHTQAIVIQYDLFACTPVLLTLGIVLAHYYGDHQGKIRPIRELIKIPPLWAVTIGVVLNLSGISQPEFLHVSLSTLAGGVVPIMLIVLGMSIRWTSLRLRFLPLLSVVALISLVFVPLSVYLISYWLGLSAQLITAITLISAMPTMVFGIVICERYRLDGELYAAAVTLTTLASLLSLPILFHLLSLS